MKAISGCNVTLNMFFAMEARTLGFSLKSPSIKHDESGLGFFAETALMKVSSLVISMEHLFSEKSVGSIQLQKLLVSV